MSFKLENVWDSMKINNYETVSEICDEMLCLLCKKLLINAHSAPCGCRFCFTCVSAYLNEKKIHCPGNSEDCKLEMISMSDNIVVDNPMNVRISKSIVKCPQVSCGYRSELRKMEEHTRICNYQLSECPYSNIGCDKCKLSNEKVPDHLQSEIVNHTKLLMNLIGNFNNEINSLKSYNNELREENQLLKNKFNEWKSNFDRIQEKIGELQRKYDEKTAKIDQLNAVIIRLNDANVSIKENMNILTLEGENNKMELHDLQRKLNDDAKEINLFKQGRMQLKNITDEIKNLKSNVKQNQTAILNKANLMEVSNIIDETMQNLDSKLLDIDTNQMFYGEFIWKIDNFSDKIAIAKDGINQSIHSKPFYSHRNGYKMILSLYPTGFGVGKGTHLSVFFCLMKSDFDDVLEWPFRHSVTIELINQRTRLAYVSDDLDYELDPDSDAFYKPVSDCGSEFGFHQFISSDELLRNRDLCLKNQIFIKCTVNILSR